ncbi:MAG: ASPIC/UnbV domain-containing protein [Gammaproteobacteria bacterium]
MIEIKDEIGNANCIGCKVFIATGSGEDEMKQIREIKAGGGFLSFDAPYAHFGLGDKAIINKLAVIWSTGERVVFKRKFEAGYKYSITRSSIANTEIN